MIFMLIDLDQPREFPLPRPVQLPIVVEDKRDAIHQVSRRSYIDAIPYDRLLEFGESGGWRFCWHRKLLTAKIVPARLAIKGFEIQPLVQVGPDGPPIHSFQSGVLGSFWPRFGEHNRWRHAYARESRERGLLGVVNSG